MGIGLLVLTFKPLYSLGKLSNLGTSQKLLVSKKDLLSF
jgi:hypothetical protein